MADAISDVINKHTPGLDGRLGRISENVHRGFGQNPIAQVRTRYSGHHFSRLALTTSKSAQKSALPTLREAQVVVGGQGTLLGMYGFCFMGSQLQIDALC